ncbi:hypothetical protein LOTGIDRAFT_234513 [Lottia gigantea]|uniref:Macroglobulin domain-containing protein n=1 Tax=Lottia gigantea TaxID=225164 RepID=V4BIM0_LOTGI|nr:hypothetical protein LOTGIDRAFT_234513 [Lottia gigantea]ESO88454.1 hypothetical protein LOTGIDRAFT_234513 [Lottia gigantea]
MECRCFILFIFSSIILTKCYATARFTYVLSAPKQFRVDTDNLVVISTKDIHDHNSQSFELTIQCGGYLQKEKLVFNKDGLQTVNIFIPSSKVPPSVQDVTMELVSGEEHRGETIPLIKSSGFIFIQTDKPIYSPRDIVKFRVLAINEDQSPSTSKVTVDITNPSGIILDRMTYEGQDAFKKKEFHLPTEADLGLWNITAAFGKDTKVSVAEFEVKEYVLPTFGVTIKPREKIINKTMDYVNIDVEARYSYTIRGVKGKCTLRLGYIDDDQIILFKKTHRSKLKLSGSASFQIPMMSILRSHSFPPHGTPLFIEVNVTERVTKIQETGVDMTSVFASDPHKIEFSSSKGYFIPDYPYQLKIDVLDAVNRPVSGTNVNIILLAGDQQTDSFETQTDHNGRCTWVLNKSLTKAVVELKFTVNVSNGQKMSSSETFK